MATHKSAGTFQTVSRATPATPATSRIWKREKLVKNTAKAGAGLMLVSLLFLLAWLPSPVLAQQSCEANGSDLRSAINNYARSCDLPRVDCDPNATGWVCASFNMPVRAQTQAQVQTQTSAAQCKFTAATLDAARTGYANSCSLPRVDCDPIDGQWTCAAYRLGSGSPGADRVTNRVTNQTEAPRNSSGIVYGGDYGPPQRSWLDSYSANGRCYIASGFDHGIGDVRVNTPAGPRTVRQIAAALGNGPGIGSNPVYNDVQCGNGPANNAGDEDVNQCPGRVDLGTPGCSMRGPQWDLSVFATPVEAAPQAQASPDVQVESPSPITTSSPIAGPRNAKSALPNDSRYQPGDLIGMHYDNSGDRDDGHATVAAKMVVSYYGLDDALHLVNGTYHTPYSRGYNANSEVVMNVTWGSEGRDSTWWNADARYDATRNATAERWRKTLQAGRKVWLAEGGPSDFTADVLRRLESTTSLNLKNIQVIQHSDWNEDHTIDANLRDVIRLASYRRIGDGNRGGNNTPDLNERNDAVTRRFLADPEFSDIWRAATNYLPVFNCDRSGPHCKFDGSDAVALMWIVGVESDEIRNWSDFASRYAN